MKPNPFDRFCRDAFAFLDESGVEYLLIGGLAVMALGEPRTTADVDVIAFVDEPRNFPFVSAPKRQVVRVPGALRGLAAIFQVVV